jgi:plastocyanin
MKKQDINKNLNIDSELHELTSNPVKPEQAENIESKNPNKRWWLIGLIIFVIIFLVAIGTFFYINNKTNKSENPQPKTTTNSTGTDFGQQKKSAHFESSTPEHGMVLAGAPNQVAIDFNFDLAKPSAISINSGGKEYATGDTVIDENLTTMRRSMDTSAPDGVYEVKYRACWPDKSCHDGNFKFQIDRSKASSYTDLRGKKEVTIEMEKIMFNPQNVIIDKGTKVTWINKEGVAHYVNTDAHPAHTHLLGFNSKALSNGGTYSYTFDQAGAYPYHCSAHASQMTGNILVEG